MGRLDAARERAGVVEAEEGPEARERGGVALGEVLEGEVLAERERRRRERVDLGRERAGAEREDRDLGRAAADLETLA